MGGACAGETWGELERRNWSGYFNYILCEILKKSVLKYFQFEIGSQQITGITKNTQFGDNCQVAINTNSV